MKISNLFNSGKTVFSFEVFPPKNTSPIESVYGKLCLLYTSYEDFDTDSSGKPCYATSGAYFVSGGAVTSFVPDKNGYAEFYISRQLLSLIHI